MRVRMGGGIGPLALAPARRPSVDTLHPVRKASIYIAFGLAGNVASDWAPRVEETTR